MSETKSNITINIVEPSVDPVPTNPTDNANAEIITIQGTEVNVPNTGFLAHGIGAKEVAALGITIFMLLAIISIIIIHYGKKHHKFNKLTNLLAKYKTSLKSKNLLAIGLSALAILVSIGTFTILIKNTVNADTDTETDEDTAIAEDTNITITVGDEPVFAYISTTITVDEEMPAGYTLKAYSVNPTLSSEGTDKTISIVTPADSITGTSELQNNTWGLALEEPESYTNQIFYSLPETAEDAIVIKSINDYSSTPAGDTTTVYYGVYITPDMPKGTYTGATVSYDIEPNRSDLAIVTFNGNGLTFDGVETNSVKYITNVPMGDKAYSHTPNVNDEGTQNTGEMYPISADRTFVYRFANATNIHVDVVETGGDATCSSDQGDYLSFWAGEHSDYTAKTDYSSGIKLNGSDGKYVFGKRYQHLETNIEDSAMTIAYTTSDSRSGWCGDLGYGYYAIITAVDADGNSVDLLGNELYAGEYLAPSSEPAYNFLGWSEDKNATNPTYISEEDLTLKLSLNPGESVTLYAIWQPAFSIVYNGNGANTATNMDNAKQYTTDLDSATQQVDLLASNFARDGYGFVGWSTDAEAWGHLTDDDDTNNPTIYGPNQTITIDENVMEEAGEDRKLVLNAVWAPAETDNNGNPIAFQGWRGCSNLTATTYNNGVLTVGKNTITALTDNRDGNIYTVARLADGNCWMTENLRLDNEPELTTANTNNPSLPLTNNYAEQTTSNYLSATSNDWCRKNNTECIDQSKLNTNNTSLTSTSPIFEQNFTNVKHLDFKGNIGSYGNYYNWYSATAGYGKYGYGSTTITGDICPSGWHLPYYGDKYSTRGASGDFYYLNQQMGGNLSSDDSNNWRSFPNNFIYSGYFPGESAIYHGNYGYYWSPKANNESIANNLYFSQNEVKLGTTYGHQGTSQKNNGLSVRCVVPAESE